MVNNPPPNLHPQDTSLILEAHPIRPHIVAVISIARSAHPGALQRVVPDPAAWHRNLLTRPREEVEGVPGLAPEALPPDD